jgi:hypothetical protein
MIRRSRAVVTNSCRRSLHFTSIGLGFKLHRQVLVNFRQDHNSFEVAFEAAFKSAGQQKAKAKYLVSRTQGLTAAAKTVTVVLFFDPRPAAAFSRGW